jgi:cyclopropane-fatty-acyl-phospholipid synthase
MVDRHGVRLAVGLALSDAQAAYIRSLADDRFDIRVESWSDHVPQAPYDAIVSIGAFEHFARPEASHRQKLEGYVEFFERCHRWLKPAGRFSLQTIAYENSTRGDLHPFIARHVWPETDLPRLADIARACERQFEVVRLRNDRADYVKTCREWIRRIAEKRSRSE